MRIKIDQMADQAWTLADIAPWAPWTFPDVTPAVPIFETCNFGIRRRDLAQS